MCLLLRVSAGLKAEAPALPCIANSQTTAILFIPVGVLTTGIKNDLPSCVACENSISNHFHGIGLTESRFTEKCRTMAIALTNKIGRIDLHRNHIFFNHGWGFGVP